MIHERKRLKITTGKKNILLNLILVEFDIFRIEVWGQSSKFRKIFSFVYLFYYFFGYMAFGLLWEKWNQIYFVFTIPPTKLAVKMRESSKWIMLDLKL